MISHFEVFFPIFAPRRRGRRAWRGVAQTSAFLAFYPDIKYLGRKTVPGRWNYPINVNRRAIANGAICAICEEWNDLRDMRDLRGRRAGFALARACENIYPTMDIDVYNQIRSGGTGFIEMPRGLIAVWGREAVQFLDGLITNDVKTLADGGQMLAAFPNAQGRLLAVVRVLRHGDRFLFETEEATREKVLNNLFRFTYAGDFFVEDLSEKYRYFEIFGGAFHGDEPSLTVGLRTRQSEPPALAGGMTFTESSRSLYVVPHDDADSFRAQLDATGAVVISADLYETLRIENGIPLYGVDMDENTIVPELGIDGLISYNKGCYIGQEIIARIHFRGHVAKQFTGLVFEDADKGVRVPAELTSPDGKNAGSVKSLTFSPKLDKTIALAYVRHDYLPEGTELFAAAELSVSVKNLPFIEPMIYNDDDNAR